MAPNAGAPNSPPAHIIAATRSMHVATAFIRTNRRNYRAVRTPFPTIAVFRKAGEDRRDVNHFRNFCP